MNLKLLKAIIFNSAFLLLLAACSPPPSGEGDAQQASTAEAEPAAEDLEAFFDMPIGTIVETPFGTTSEGEQVTRFTLDNGAGISVDIIDYGAIIVSINTQDREGVIEDIVLGYSTLAEYEADEMYMGAVVGRYANRIANGRFELDGESYQLAANNGPNHLHGGKRGFNKVVWDARAVPSDDGPGLVLNYTSADGEEGYPGNLQVQVTYRLTRSGKLGVAYEATTDKATPINLTSHSYFNLSGNAKRDILGHELRLFPPRYTPINADLIPTGEVVSVFETPFDFRRTAVIGKRLEAEHEQLQLAGGFDHNMVLDKTGRAGMVSVGVLYDPESGRQLSIRTDEPAVQLYTGNFLDGSVSGKGVTFGKHYGICIETQHFPDSPNQPEFPSTILQPGQTFNSRTVYAFSTKY